MVGGARLTPRAERWRLAAFALGFVAAGLWAQRALLPGKREGGDAALKLMDDHLAGRDWLVGDAPSVADICLYAYTHVAEEGGFSLAPWPAVRAWVARVERLEGGHAWTEDPPSRTRRFVTNVRAHVAGSGELDVDSYILLYRSRADDRPAEVLSAARRDRLRAAGHGWLLARREITVDDAVLRMQNLALFL